LDTNLTGTFRLLRAFYNLARQHPGSSATVFSSVVAQMGVPGTAAYAASKSGLTGLVRTLSQEWGRSGLRVNGIHLGYYDKGMIQQVSREQQEALVQRVPLGRLGNEDDLYEACLFCFQCQYLTGSMIHLNGGLL
jgi:NAD(P)-dependent dehydrogenase (short-subunit alcohol dehydrogenase family)